VAGAGCLILDNYVQCAEMTQGSRFLAELGNSLGTGRWAAIGSDNDTVVPCGSASWSQGPITAGSNSRRFCYVSPAYDHGGFLQDPSQLRDASYHISGSQGGPERRAAAFAAEFMIG
jgi:hypothetical protein